MAWHLREEYLAVLAVDRSPIEEPPPDRTVFPGHLDLAARSQVRSERAEQDLIVPKLFSGEVQFGDIVSARGKMLKTPM
jgi:hypothetical protein